MAMVTFGAERKRGVMIGFAALLIAVSVGIVIAWQRTGGRINGSILIPAGVGIALLFRRSGGTIEYEPGQDEVVITRRSTLQSRVTRLKKSEIKALTIAPVGTVQELRFDLAGGKHFVLLRHPNERELASDREAVSKFVVDQKLV